MAKSRDQKEADLKLLDERIAKSKSLVFTIENGVKVFDMEELRTSLRQQGCEYQVVKKSLWNRIAQDKGWIVDNKSVMGTMAVAYSYEDDAAAARIIAIFSKKHHGLQPIGGLLEGAIVDSTQIMVLASLPSKPELIGMLLRMLQSPVTGLVNVLQGNLRGLVTVLDAIKNNK